MAFDKGDVNRPITVSFNTCQKRDTKSSQGSSTSPVTSLSVRHGKRAETPTRLVDGENEAVDDLVDRISEAKMHVSIKALFFQIYKSPPQDHWSGPDGVCTKIMTDLYCSAQAVLKVIMRLDADNLDVSVRADASGGHNKNIRLGTATEYKKKLDKLFKEKRDSKTGPKGGKYTWVDYDGENL